MFAAGDDFKIISTHAPRTARKSIFKLWKMCYTVRMDRTTLIDFFEKACKEKVKPQIGLAARKFGRRWGERSAAQISHHKVPA